MRRGGEVHDSGQMTVGLAAMLPVIVVVALIVYGCCRLRDRGRDTESPEFKYV